MSLVKFKVKFLVLGIVWVYILAIEVNDRPLFDNARSVLIENHAVYLVESELSTLWLKVCETAKISYKEIVGSDTFDL